MRRFTMDKSLMGLEEEAHAKAQALVIKLCNFMDDLKMGKSNEYPHGVASNAALELDSLCAVIHYHSFIRSILGDNPECKCDLAPLCPVHDKDLL